MPALVGVVGMVEITVAGYDPLWPALASYLLAAVVLCAGRLAPLAVPLLVTGIYATTPLLGFDVSEPASWVPLIAFACFSTGLHAPRSRTLAGLVSVLAALAIAYRARRDGVHADVLRLTRSPARGWIARSRSPASGRCP